MLERINEMLQVKKLQKDAVVPTKGSKDAAGYDLYSIDSIYIKARSSVIVSTGIALSVPEDCYGRIASRSGLSCKHSIEVGAGVIDKDYRGEVKVILHNHSSNNLYFPKHTRCAQLILEKVLYTDIQVVDELTDTVRKEQGFGSSGNNLVAESSDSEQIQLQ